jgi:hypothetical protein
LDDVEANNPLESKELQEDIVRRKVSLHALVEPQDAHDSKNSADEFDDTEPYGCEMPAVGRRTVDACC